MSTPRRPRCIGACAKWDVLQGSGYELTPLFAGSSPWILGTGSRPWHLTFLTTNLWSEKRWPDGVAVLSHNPTMVVTLRHRTGSISVHVFGKRSKAWATDLSKRGERAAVLSHNPTMVVTLRHRTGSISVHVFGKRGKAWATDLSKRGEGAAVLSHNPTMAVIPGIPPAGNHCPDVQQTRPCLDQAALVQGGGQLHCAKKMEMQPHHET